MLEDLAGVVVDAKPLCIACAERAGFDLTTERQTQGRILFLSELEGDTHCAGCGHCFDHPECGAPAGNRPGFTVKRIAGLSAQRRHNLQRRMLERCDDREAQLVWGPPEVAARRYRRALAVLGRFILLCEQHPARP